MTSTAAQTATLRLNSSMQTMDSWQTYVGGSDSNAPPAAASSRPSPPSGSLGSRLIARSNLFRPQRKPNNSIYSIDVPKDTLYLHVDHGKVSPVDRDYGTRADSPVSAISNEDSSTEVKPPVPLKAASRGLFGHEKRTSSVPRGFSAKAQEWIAPASRFSWSTQAASESYRDGAAKSPELPGLPEFDTSLRSHIQSQIPNSRFSWTTYNTESQPQFPVSPEHSPDFAKLPEEPRSRFSWTTNNTTSTPMTRGGPQMSPRSSVSMRHQPPSPPPSPPSVLHRARPISRPDSHLNAIKRKPAPSELAIPESPEMSSDGKELPLSPPEMASVDIITALQAQINQLERSRFNLEKAINNTSTLQLQNPLVNDLAKRRSDKDKIERLEQELSDVRRKEHELGLKLHRALKRRDQEEPCGLWVRRVTS